MRVGESRLTPELEELWSAGLDWVKELRKEYYLYAQKLSPTHVFLEGRELGVEVLFIVDQSKYKTKEELLRAVKDLLSRAGFPTKEAIREWHRRQRAEARRKMGLPPED